MNRALLERPFLDSEIKHREGNHGTVSYVDGATVIQRLNDSFDGNWSFEITDYIPDSTTSDPYLQVFPKCKILLYIHTTDKSDSLIDDKHLLVCPS